MKIVVIDDDPTGSQTVYDCPLLLDWELETLRKGLQHHSPFLFILGNTRSMLAEHAAERIVDICKSFRQAAEIEGIPINDFLFISRGDSTLRGHGFLEPNILNKELGPFDATFHVPAFLEGGRTTVSGVHFLNGIPLHKTCFARDKIFGYSTSDLSDWLEEKSGGLITSENVNKISIEFLESACQSTNGMDKLIYYISGLFLNQPVVVDAEHPIHLEIFAKVIRNLCTEKRFLFRSAASLLNYLGNLPPRKFNSKLFSRLRVADKYGRYKPGLILVGSHVELADAQLEVLLNEDSCVGVELSVSKIAGIFYGSKSNILMKSLKEEWCAKIYKIIDDGKTPVLFTSRRELEFNSALSRLEFGLKLAKLMADLVRCLTPRIGYIISKGGITSHYILSEGLQLHYVELIGQILPGLSVVTPPAEDRNNFPIITFPGNLGDQNTLLLSWRLMEEIVNVDLVNMRNY